MRKDESQGLRGAVFSSILVYLKRAMEIRKLYKRAGEINLQCLQRFRYDNPEYIDRKMTYAGRLDPLAEGVLLRR